MEIEPDTTDAAEPKNVIDINDLRRAIQDGVQGQESSEAVRGAIYEVLKPNEVYLLEYNPDKSITYAVNKNGKLHLLKSIMDAFQEVEV